MTLPAVTESVTFPSWAKEVVRRLLPVRDLYELLTKGDATNRAVYCPFHRNADTPAMELRDRIGRFHCHGCGHDSDHAGFFVAFAALRRVAVAYDQAWFCLAHLAGLDLADGSEIAKASAIVLMDRFGRRCAGDLYAREARRIAVEFSVRAGVSATAAYLRSELAERHRQDERATWGDCAFSPPIPAPAADVVAEIDRVFELADEVETAPPESRFPALEALREFVADRERVRRLVQDFDEELDERQGSP
jgi:hypothetical protein